MVVVVAVFVAVAVVAIVEDNSTDTVVDCRECVVSAESLGIELVVFPIFGDAFDDVDEKMLLILGDVNERVGVAFEVDDIDDDSLVVLTGMNLVDFSEEGVIIAKVLEVVEVVSVLSIKVDRVVGSVETDVSVEMSPCVETDSSVEVYD